ncbi:Ig-like domain-containing protein [Candidatus Weimeria sp. HCP3S3_B5]|uniref:Ig-like domain-containing protein n=1 Tax=Candidatus Weimeria sp. HCP3S3_B5 TaxID=3438871 RepID=UPI003F894DCB
MKKGLAVALAAVTAFTFAPATAFAGTSAATARTTGTDNGKTTYIKATGLMTTMNESANVWSYNNTVTSSALTDQQTAVVVLTPSNPEGSVTFTQKITGDETLSDGKWYSVGTQSGNTVLSGSVASDSTDKAIELTAGKNSKTLKITASVAKLRQVTNPEKYIVSSNVGGLLPNTKVTVILARRAVKMNNLKVTLNTAGDSAKDRYLQHDVDEYNAFEARPTGITGADITTDDVDVALDGKPIGTVNMNLADSSKDKTFTVDTNADVAYKSDDTSIATIDKDGIHAKAVGETNVSITTKESTTAYGEVKVTIPVKVVNKPTATLSVPDDIYVHGKGKENSTVIGATGTNIQKNSIVYDFVYWDAKTQDYVSFKTSTRNVLNPFRLDTSKDTVYVDSYTGDDDNRYTWDAYLKVTATAAPGYKEPDAKYIRLHFVKDAFDLDSTSQILHIGESVQITAQAESTVATGGAFTYKSWNPAVATVSDTGVIKAVGEGSTRVDVTYGGTTKPVYVTVKAYENGAGSKAAPEKVTGVKVSNKKGAKVSVKWDSQDSSVNFRVYKKVGSGKWIAKNVTSNKATLSVKKGAKVTVKVKAFTKGTNGKTTWGPKATSKSLKTDRK